MISQPGLAPEIDNSALENLDIKRLQVNMADSNKRGVIYGTIVNQQPPATEEEPATEPEATEPEETEEETVVEEVEEVDDSLFSAQFEQTFGVKPQEAVELVNSLQAFRDEQTLMRNWGVSPTEYDQRMEEVRVFYNSLPEDGREQFNTVEGAVAIWEHLQKTGQAKKPQKKTTATNNRVKRPSQAPTYDFTRDQILKMSREEYQQKLPAIVRAFQSGRVAE